MIFETDEPLAGIDFPKPKAKIAVPLEIKELHLEKVRALSTKIEVHVRDEVTPSMGWIKRARFILSMVERYGDDVLARIEEVAVGSPKDQVRVATDTLMWLAKLVESKVDWIPRYIERLVWPLLEWGVKRIAKKILRARGVAV